MSNPGTSDSRAPSPGVSSPGTSDSGAPSPGAPDPSSDDVQVAWVPPGPGNLFPHYDDSDTRWRSAFANHDCDAIAALGPDRNQQQLYTGLGDACGAALKKNNQSWPSAQVALQHIDNPTDPLDKSALRLLRDLVMAHQRAPHATIRIVDPPPASPSPTSDIQASPSVAPSSASQIPATPHHRPYSSIPPG